MARVLHLFRAPERRSPMEEFASAEVVKDAGFEGCAHARPGNRQVLLVAAEMLGVFQLQPGITTEGLEVSAVCAPCEQIEALRPRLRGEMQGRRGMLCGVLTGGTLQRGDVIELKEKTLTAQNSGAD
jgi:hypothetical protein